MLEKNASGGSYNANGQRNNHTTFAGRGHTGCRCAARGVPPLPLGAIDRVYKRRPQTGTRSFVGRASKSAPKRSPFFVKNRDVTADLVCEMDHE
jgi:hypothetical protein